MSHPATGCRALFLLKEMVVAALDSFSLPQRKTIAECSEVAANAYAKILAPSITPTEEEVARALGVLGMGEDGVVCAYCGAPAKDWHPLRPLVRDRRPTGYFAEIHNLVPTCPECSRSKGDRPWREWIDGGEEGSPKARGVADLDARIARLEAYENTFTPRTIRYQSVMGTDVWEKYWEKCDVFGVLIHDSQELGAEIAARFQALAEERIEKRQQHDQRRLQIDAGLSAVNALAREYRALFAQPGTDLDADRFEERWSALGFKMDYGDSFVAAYTWDAFLSIDKLQEVIGGIDDVQLLGDAIYSEWRYITHVADTHAEEEIRWLLIALDRLISLTA